MPSTTETVDVGGVRLRLSPPDETDRAWIGQREVLTQLHACWLTVDEADLPLSPRITGSTLTRSVMLMPSSWLPSGM